MRKCISAESSQDDLWGKLICTNFKVSFIPQDVPAKQVFVWTEVLNISQFLVVVQICSALLMQLVGCP